MDEILKYAVENGIIDLSNIQILIEVDKRKKYLEKHNYKIWQGKNGKWYTYLPDKENGRVQVKRNDRNSLENVIISYWEEEAKNPTIEDIYHEWIFGKLEREEITITTKNRYDRQYNESMCDFGKKRIKDVDEYDIELFILNAIHVHDLTAKGFANLRTIIYGIFRLAKKKKYISFSITEVIADIDISKKKFRKIRHSDDQLIFMDDEIEEIIQYFSKRKLDLKDLGIILMFYTGMRPGELSGLEWCDVTKNIINICRTEIRYEDENKKYIYEVRNFPKTEAGIRGIIIPESGMWVLKEIRKINPFGRYVFEQDGIRIKSCLFDKRIRSICNKLNITEKSLNKIRKTYGTMLIDKKVDESLILSQMGHTDIRTTKEHYYQNTKSNDQKTNIINDVFCNKMMININ